MSDALHALILAAQMLGPLAADLHDLTGRNVSLPNVQIVSPAELSRLACSGGCSLKGAYLSGTIYLSGDVEVDTPFGRSVLFHELRHHQQTEQRGAARNCEEWLAREREAYEAQNWYLAAVEGVPTQAVFSGSCR